MSSANIRALPKQYSAFSPRAIPGCGLWLDAADANTVTLSGANVTQWGDKSGNARNATAVNTITTSSNNMVFNGTGYFNVNLDFLASVSHFAFIVCSNTNFVNIYGATTGFQDVRSLHIGFISSGAYRMSTWGSGYNPSITSNYKSGQRNILEFFWNTSTSRTVYANGGLEGTSNITGTVGTMRDGGTIGNVTGQGIFQGSINEIIFYTSASGSPLTTSERQQVEGYLAQKWGLTTNLPVTHPHRSLPLFTRFFQPSDIENCTLWLDAADASTMTLSGSNVTQWNDKSGNGRNATGGVSPTFSNNGVVFNGTTQYLTTTYSSTPSAETVFCVCTFSPSSSADGGYFIIGGTQQNGRGYGVFRASSVDSVRWDKYQVASYAPTTGLTTNVRFLTSAIFNGTSGTTGLNGGNQSASVNFSFSGTGTTNVGAIGTGPPVGFYNGTVNEIIIYSTALSATQRQQVEGYLAWKWGLQGNLPSGQPFKLFQTPSVLFTPPAISGCSVWFDAMDNSTITLSGSSVTSVKDKAQNITFTTQGTSSLLTLSNAINSRQSLYFDNSAGNSVYLQGTLSNLTRGSAFIVWRAATQLSADYRPFYSWQSTGSLRFPAFGYVGSLTTVAPYTTFGGPGTPTNTVAAGTNYLTFYSWSGTTTNVGFNAATPTAGTQPSYTSSTSTFTIMGEVAGTLYGTTGYIGEMIIYNEVLSASQRQQVEGYLAWKWGLQANVPSSHPFSKLRP